MKRVILFFVLSIFCSSLMAQLQNEEWRKINSDLGIEYKQAKAFDNAQKLPNHKIYKGPFAAFGVVKEDGYVEYEYIEDSNGKRLFDGQFVFRTEHFRVSGQFKNDFQIGEWIYDYNTHTEIVNFNEENYHFDGKFQIYGFGPHTYVNGRFIIGGKKEVRIGQFQNGHLKFLKVRTKNNNDYIALYNKSRLVDLYLIGSSYKWYLDGPSLFIYEIDNTSGDKRLCNIWVDGYDSPQGAFEMMYIKLPNYALRSTRKAVLKNKLLINNLY